MSDHYGRDDHDHLNGKECPSKASVVLSERYEQSALKLHHILLIYDRYVLNQNDEDSLNDCQQELRQFISESNSIQGDHKVFAALSFVAQEIANTMALLASQTISHRDDTLSTIREAIHFLSDYLADSFKREHRDNSEPENIVLPLAMVLIVNDLRSLQGKYLLSETPLFIPVLPDHINHRPVAEKAILEEVVATQVEVIAKLRQMYQIALIGFFKSSASEERHQQLFQIFEQMEAICSELPVGEIWSIASLLLQAVISGRVANRVTVRNLLRQLDSILGALVNEGGEAFNRRYEPFLTNTLFYITVADSGRDTPKKTDIKHLHGLSEQRDFVVQPKPEVIIEKIVSILVTARERLPTSDDQSNDKTGLIIQQQANLRQVTDALIVLGYTDLSKKMAVQIDALSNIVNQSNINQTTNNRSALMNIVSHLLSVEQQLVQLLYPSTNHGVDDDRENGMITGPKESELQKQTPIPTDAFNNFVNRYSTQPNKAFHRLRGWNRQANAEVIKVNQDMLAELTREAKALELYECFRLSELLVAVYQAIGQQSSAVSDVVSQVLTVAHEHLIEIMHQIVQQQSVMVSEELLERLQCLLVEMNNTNPKSGKRCRSVGESVDSTFDADDELLAIFLNEAMDNLDKAGEALTQWLNTKDPQQLTVLQRHLHTIKGSARMTGMGSIGDLAHELEDLYEALVLKRLQVSSDLISLLMRSHDMLEDMLSAIRSHHPSLSAEGLCNEIHKVMAVADPTPVFVPFPLSEQLPEQQQQQSEQKPAPLSEKLSKQLPRKVSKTTQVNHAEADEHTEHPAKKRRESLVRVSSLLLDRIVDLAGQTSTSLSSMELWIEKSRRALLEVDNTIHRLEKQLTQLNREITSPLSENENVEPLSKALVESVTDLNSLKDMLVKQNHRSSALLAQQIITHKEVHTGLVSTRMVPFERMIPRLQHIVRTLSRELDKPVELVIEKSQGEIDRALMEEIITPLEHMLCNAIDHGIESTTAARLALGKPKNGTISMSLNREGDEICLTIADDGQGINLEEIRERAKLRGILSDENITDATLADLIFVPGISAAPTLTQISGRGVGMDVVKNVLENLGGQISVQTVSGRGTEFTIRLPCIISLCRTLIVVLDNKHYAVPLNVLESVTRRPASELQKQYEMSCPQITDSHKHYDLYHLGHLLNQDATSDYPSNSFVENGKTEQSILLLKMDDRNIAVQVDAVLDSREVVVKSASDQFANVKGIRGATTLGDSHVVMILDLSELIAELDGGDVGQNQIGQDKDGQKVVINKPAQQEKTTPDSNTKEQKTTVNNGLDRSLVMIVDDSITVRKVTGRLLKENGYRTVTARDGVEAMSLLQDHRPSVILLDIEMPRMDGFQVATAIRNMPELQQTPIIMITSRAASGNRERALEIGVNNYMGKPFQEARLLEAVSTFTGGSDR